MAVDYYIDAASFVSMESIFWFLV